MTLRHIVLLFTTLLVVFSEGRAIGSGGSIINNDIFEAPDDATRLRYSKAWNHLDLAESSSKLDPTVLTKLGDDLLDANFATFLEGGVGRVKAWEALSDNQSFRTNFDYLEYTDEYLARPGKTSQQLLEDLEDFSDPKNVFLDELKDTPASGTYVNNPSGVWNENPLKRGREIEQALGQNLHDNFPWIDKFDPALGTVTSIKSTDTYAKSYQNLDNLEGLWKKYVDDLAGMPPPNTPIVFADDVVQGYTKQILEIAIPDPLNSGQNSILNSVINYAKGKGVNGTDIEIVIQVIE